MFGIMDNILMLFLGFVFGTYIMGNFMYIYDLKAEDKECPKYPFDYYCAQMNNETPVCIFCKDDLCSGVVPLKNMTQEPPILLGSDYKYHYSSLPRISR
jgi:hypothetical protein